MTDGRAAGRLLRIALLAGLLPVGAAACSSSSAADVAVTVPVTGPTNVAATAAPTAAMVEPTMPLSDPATTSPIETTVAAPAAAPIDGAPLLAAAIAGLSTTYHFTTVVTVDGTVVLSADGDHVGDGVRLALTAPAGVVNYIITPDGSWVMPDGGEWEQLDSAAATSDPITALAAPSNVAVSVSDGTSTTLSVTVPATAVGLPPGPDVTMTCELVGADLRHVQYASVVDGKPAIVLTELGPVVDGSPVVAPA